MCSQIIQLHFFCVIIYEIHNPFKRVSPQIPYNFTCLRFIQQEIWNIGNFRFVHLIRRHVNYTKNNVFSLSTHVRSQLSKIGIELRTLRTLEIKCSYHYDVMLVFRVGFLYSGLIGGVRQLLNQFLRSFAIKSILFINPSIQNLRLYLICLNFLHELLDLKIQWIL